MEQKQNNELTFKKCFNDIDAISQEVFDENSDIIYIIYIDSDTNKITFFCYDKNSLIEQINFNKQSVNNHNNNYIDNYINLFTFIQIMIKRDTDTNIFITHNLFYFNKVDAINDNGQITYLCEIIPLNQNFMSLNDKLKIRLLQLPYQDILLQLPIENIEYYILLCEYSIIIPSKYTLYSELLDVIIDNYQNDNNDVNEDNDLYIDYIKELEYFINNDTDAINGMYNKLSSLSLEAYSKFFILPFEVKKTSLEIDFYKNTHFVRMMERDYINNDEFINLVNVLTKDCFFEEYFEVIKSLYFSDTSIKRKIIYDYINSYLLDNIIISCQDKIDNILSILNNINYKVLNIDKFFNVDTNYKYNKLLSEIEGIITNIEYVKDIMFKIFNFQFYLENKRLHDYFGDNNHIHEKIYNINKHLSKIIYKMSNNKLSNNKMSNNFNETFIERIRIINNKLNKFKDDDNTYKQTRGSIKNSVEKISDYFFG